VNLPQISSGILFAITENFIEVHHRVARQAERNGFASHFLVVLFDEALRGLTGFDSGRTNFKSMTSMHFQADSSLKPPVILQNFLLNLPSPNPSHHSVSSTSMEQFSPSKSAQPSHSQS
jgi:hypothetical protein